MIDLHCHILPGIDDGPPDMAASVELGRALAAAGVTVVAATPHLRADHPGVRVAELAERCGAVNEALEKERIGLAVVSGGEMDLLWGLNADAEELRLASYGQRGSDLLVETPSGTLPDRLDGRLLELGSAGYRLLLAHPERNADFQDDPEMVEDLARDGVLLQITVGTLLRAPRKSRSARLARRLLEGGFAHVLASDAHSAGGRGRAPRWEALVEARELIGERADWMAERAPRAILEGSRLPPPPPLPRRGGLLRRLASR